jgi:hypothetical protein
MGRLTQTATPAPDTVLTLVIQRAKIAGLRAAERPIGMHSPAFA